MTYSYLYLDSRTFVTCYIFPIIEWIVKNWGSKYGDIHIQYTSSSDTSFPSTLHYLISFFPFSSHVIYKSLHIYFHVFTLKKQHSPFNSFTEIFNSHGEYIFFNICYLVIKSIQIQSTPLVSTRCLDVRRHKIMINHADGTSWIDVIDKTNWCDEIVHEHLVLSEWHFDIFMFHEMTNLDRHFFTVI